MSLSTRTACAFESCQSRSGENWRDGRSHVEVAMVLIIGCCKTNQIFVRNYSNLLLRLGRLGLGTSSGSRTAADQACAFETRGVDDRMLQNEPNFCSRFEGLTASMRKFRDSRRAPSSSTRTSADSAYAFETRKSRSAENRRDGRSHVEVATALTTGCCKTNPNSSAVAKFGTAPLWFF